MAYTKHEWVTGEIITAANLNHIEDGIASKLDASAVVNSQEADTPGTALDAMQGNPDVPGSLAAQIKEAGESSKAIVLTQAQYDALTEEEKDSDNVYYISDAPFESSNVVPLTRAEYDALTEATKNDGRFYYITDEEEVAKSLVVQTNVNSTETVPSSKVVYDLKADTDADIEELTNFITEQTVLLNETNSTYNITIQAYKVGNIVTVCLLRESGGTGSTGWTTIASLPTGARPRYLIYNYSPNGNFNAVIRSRILSDGQIQIWGVPAANIQLGVSFAFGA